MLVFVLASGFLLLVRTLGPCNILLVVVRLLFRFPPFFPRRFTSRHFRSSSPLVLLFGLLFVFSFLIFSSVLLYPCLSTPPRLPEPC